MPRGNPSRKGTTAYAIHEGLRKGGGLKQIRRHTLLVFEETIALQGDDRKKAKRLLKNNYLTSAEILRVAGQLKDKGYRVRIKGKGDDIYVKVSDSE